MDISSKLTNENKIGLFDSGVGQLSVYLDVKKLLPLENFVIFADQKNMPYGEKTAAQIKKYVTQAAGFLIKKHNIKMLILACNTATVLALDELRKKFPIPIIGVVPAIKPANELTKNHKIASLSTSATAKSAYLANLVEKFAPNSKVLKLGCPGLENAIETLNQKDIEKLTNIYVSKVNAFSPDVVVLGCTHYPLVKQTIQKHLLPGVKIIDSGEAVAKQVKKVLTSSNQRSSKKEKDIFYTTGNAEIFSSVSSTLLGEKVTASKISVDA